MRYWLIIVALFLLSCGYKPASYYTKMVLQDKIFADLQINIDDPQSGIVSLDSLKEAVITKFGSRLVNSKDEATSIITITSASQSFSALQRDSNGFAVLYRASVGMDVIVESHKINKESFSVAGFYDFAVTPSSSILSESEKNIATKEAALKALDELIARIVLIGR